jgi:hypothetical protein
MNTPKQLENGKFFELSKDNSSVAAAKAPADSKSWKTNLIQIDKVESKAGYICDPTVASVFDLEGPVKDGKLNPRYNELKEKFDSLDTFTVETPSGGRHYYVKPIDFSVKTYKKFGTIGEWRVADCYVVAPGSKLLDKEYKVIHDAPIREVSEKNVFNFVGLQTEEKKYIDIKEDTDPEDHSATEFGNLCAYIRKGMTKENIWKKMSNSLKWTTTGNAYREHQYKRALEAVEAEKKVPETHKKEPVVRSVDDIMNFKKSDQYLIEGVMYPNTVNCITSEFSSFKSIIALNIAICVSGGLDLFDMFKTTKGAVLIIDNENNMQEIKSRIDSLEKGMNYVRTNMDIHFIMREGKLDQPEFLQFVRNYVKEHNIKLIILDTLLRMHNLEENSSSQMNTIYDAFCSLLINDASVLFLHHTNKQGKFRGTGDILGMVDSSFIIERPEKQGPRFIMENDKNRMGEIGKLFGNVNYNKATNTTSIDAELKTSDEIIKESKQDRTFRQNFIASFAVKNDKFIKQDLIKYMNKWNDINKDNQLKRTSIQNTLNWFIEKNMIITDGKNHSINSENVEQFEAWAANIPAWGTQTTLIGGDQ